jgi:hypothetical protein
MHHSTQPLTLEGGVEAAAAAEQYNPYYGCDSRCFFESRI